MQAKSFRGGKVDALLIIEEESGPEIKRRRRKREEQEDCDANLADGLAIAASE